MAYEIKIEDVTGRLKSFGYSATKEDDFDLMFAATKAANFIRNSCNILDIPDELREVAIDMAVAEFLYTKKQAGLLDMGDLFQAPMKSIEEGDTTVAFGEGATPEQRFDAMLDRMLHPAGLARFRRFTW